MSYLNVIKTALLVFPVVSLVLCLPFLIYHYRKYGTVSFFRFLVVFSFAFYLICIYFLVILPLPSIESVSHYTSLYYNFKPFFVIPEVIFSSGFSYDFLEPFFNILMFIPFGMYLHYYFKCSFLKTVIFSFIFSLFFEVTQLTGLYFIYPRPYRLFDVNDLINNTTGGIIGYIFMPIFSLLLPNRDKLDSTDYIKGDVVGVGRTIVASIIDYALIFLMLFVLWIFDFNYLSFIYILATFIVFVIFPKLSNGYTFGKWFLKFKNISSSDDGSISFSKYTFRWFFVHLLLVNGWLLLLLFNEFCFSLPNFVFNIYFLIVFVFFIYCFNCIIVRKDFLFNSFLDISNESLIDVSDGDDYEI